MRYLENKLILITIYVLGHLSTYHCFAYTLASEESNLLLAKEIIAAIKSDKNNTSFTTMIDQIVMKQRTLTSHENKQPYFYTDNRFIISEIISMVVENPDGVENKIDQPGVLQIYRQFEFDSEIAPLFRKEKIIPQNKIGDYLGITPQGPTNRVVVFIKTKNFEKLKRELAQKKFNPQENIKFIDAFPSNK